MTGNQIPTPVLEEYRLLLEQHKPGAAIKLMREEQGITLAQITQETLIPEWKLSDLENDVYEGLGGTIFVMGYMRKIARILDVDADPLILAFGRDPSRTQEGEPVLLNPEEQKAAKAAASERKSLNKKPIGRKLPGPVAIVVLLLIWIAAVFWMKNDSDGEATQPSSSAVSSESLSASTESAASVSAEETLLQMPSESPASTDVSDTPAEEASLSVMNEQLSTGAEELDVPEQTVESDNEFERADAVTQEKATEVVVGQAAGGSAADTLSQAVDVASPGNTNGEQLISVLFTEDCWIQVTDANGKVLFAELQRTGDNLQLFGQAPFRVMLGNARAANISYNGETVDFNPVPGRDTLRLTVGD